MRWPAWYTSLWANGLCGKLIDGEREQTGTVRGEMYLSKVNNLAEVELGTFSLPQADSDTQNRMSN